MACLMLIFIITLLSEGRSETLSKDKINLHPSPTAFGFVGEIFNITCKPFNNWKDLRMVSENYQNSPILYYQSNYLCENFASEIQNHFIPFCDPENQDFGITIPGLEFDDNNVQIFCKASFWNDTTEYFDMTKISVQIYLYNLTINTESSFDTFKHGENYTVICSSSPLTYANRTNINWHLENSFGLKKNIQGIIDTERYGNLTVMYSKATFTAKMDDGDVILICEGTDGLSSVRSNSLQIRTIDGPNHVRVVPSRSTITLNNGGISSNIYCISDCNPACNYTWFRDKVQVGNGKYFPYSNVFFTDHGEYRCQVSNTELNITMSAAFTLDVEDFGPDIILTENGTYKITENRSFQLPCDLIEVETFFKINKLEFDAKQENLVMHKSFAVLNSSVVNDLTCFDSGNYICVNELNCHDKKYINVSISVLCGPKFLQTNVTTSFSRNDIGFAMRIPVFFIGNPPPKCKWTFRQAKSNSSFIISNGYSHFSIRRYSNRFLHSEVIQKDIFEESDVGEFLVTLENNYGRCNMTITLKGKDQTEMLMPILVSVACCVILAVVSILAYLSVKSHKRGKRLGYPSDNAVDHLYINANDAGDIPINPVVEEYEDCDNVVVYQNSGRIIEIAAELPYEDLEVNDDDISEYI